MTIDIAYGGTAATPTTTHTGISVIGLSLTAETVAKLREQQDGTVTKIASPLIMRWKFKFSPLQYPDTTAGITALGYVTSWWASQPKFIRNYTPSALWTSMHGPTQWIQVVEDDPKLPMPREADLYLFEGTLREASVFTTTIS